MQINKENYTFFAKNPSRAEFLMEVIYSCFIREGDFVIDVGANRGLHTAPLAQLVGKQGRVFAFEAIPALAKNLQSHFINDQVTVLAGAVTNHKIAAEHKELSFSHVVNLNTRSGILRRQDVKDEWMPETITVPAMTLDDMISPTTLISFIKIDTEGGDFNVLQGGEGILRRSNPFFIFESGRESAASLYNYSKRDFFSFFNDLGYQLFVFTGERFTDDLWDAKDVYWELWGCHSSSPLLSFFCHNLRQLVSSFVRQYQRCA